MSKTKSIDIHKQNIQNILMDKYGEDLTQAQVEGLESIISVCLTEFDLMESTQLAQFCDRIKSNDGNVLFAAIDCGLLLIGRAKAVQTTPMKKFFLTSDMYEVKSRHGDVIIKCAEAHIGTDAEHIDIPEEGEYIEIVFLDMHTTRVYAVEKIVEETLCGKCIVATPLN